MTEAVVVEVVVEKIEWKFKGSSRKRGSSIKLALPLGSIKVAVVEDLVV